ncbi:MAG: ribonuclease HII [Gammaproteobacteria bacterium]|nr:ribonuclease HII [Gammaproteobacteria bacterium]NNF50690.1 ribonuclease HII [Woeseiaceae bacterium]MBT8093952.1 ribonuclease HII [Gammaproteobacteria bacterium]MBT8106582.1 ribonuclease HII [Gammaproteobacteria bacterium]NNK26597.1 ribonuclease HII [Woeseiaceae bacterium]
MQQARLFETSGPVAGVDEAGRGPLAGPVVAAAVILDARDPIAGLADSKKLGASKRAALACEIRARARSWAVGWSDPGEIDEINILAATMLAMRRAVGHLAIVPGTVKVDGNRLPDLIFGEARLHGEAIVGGDGKVDAISAASIIAKTTRDAVMEYFDRIYPAYGFAQHKGYGTALHLERLHHYGPCDLHRASYAPVRAAL